MGIKNNPRSGMSWSKMRKILEQENICNSLKGRIQYFQTRYREAHDQTSRVAIRLDGKEIFTSDYFEFVKKQWELGQQMKQEVGRIDHGDIYKELNSQGYNYSFYNSFYAYHNTSIEESLKSSDSMVRLFAILDKRVGKRRLKKLALEVNKQPRWLQVFYRLRLETESIQHEEA